MDGKILVFKGKSLLLKIGPKLSDHKQLVMLQDITVVDDLHKERYKFSFLSTATHELNTPLHSLLQSIEMLEIAQNPSQEVVIKTAKRSVKALRDIVNNSTVKWLSAPVKCGE
jgi:signal transduction histidine kinase